MVKLPKEFTGPVSSFHWAPTSAKILVAAADHIHVFSATDVPFHAAIQTAAFGTGKLSSVRFGPKDTDIIACSSLGLKIAVFDLITSTAIEIANPKFYLSSSVSRTYAVRPQSHHLAILTRVNGKDVVSVHNPSNRQVQKSWTADTVDAQAVLWTPDGHWLVLWDSPAQGHRIALYTADGQHFSTMTSANLNVQKDAELAPGITTCQPSPDSRWLAVGDHSRGITMLSTLFWRPRMTLQHPNTVTPRDTLQVWCREPINIGLRRIFVLTLSIRSGRNSWLRRRTANHLALSCVPRRVLHRQRLFPRERPVRILNKDAPLPYSTRHHHCSPPCWRMRLVPSGYGMSHLKSSEPLSFSIQILAWLGIPP